MKKYYIDPIITYCYPYDVTQRTKDYGVLSKYIGKKFNRSKMDQIVCEMITRHPYIDHSMCLRIHVMWEENDVAGFYHMLDFKNDNHDEQSKGTTEIRYEK